MLKLIISIVFVTLVTGCATSIPVQKETVSLNLEYTTSSQKGGQTGKVFALISPDFGSSAEGVNPKGNGKVASSLVASLIAGQQQFAGPYANAALQSKYQARLRLAMQSGLEDLVSKRGFNVKGPFSTLDDMSYGEKKASYLAVVPKLSLYFDEQITNQDCSNRGLSCFAEGNFSVAGELLLRVIEPLTGQSVITKRIDLTSFNIAKKYRREFQARTQSNGLDGALIDKMFAPKELHDNSEKAIVEAVNEFYQLAMGKIDNLLSREELLSFEADVDQLKGSKRF